MKPGEETPQNWQQPAQNLSQAPYQATPDTSAAATPAPVAPVTPAAQPVSASTQVQSTQAVAPTHIDPVTTQVGQVAVERQIETSDLADVDDKAIDGASTQDTDTGDDALLRWQATEYIHHERTALWYVILGIVVVAFIALALLVFNSITFAILIPVMLIALVVYVRRPPSILNYVLSRKGLHVNDHLYSYDQFKAFGVVSHDELHSVVLLPRKRFQVSQTVYFPEDVGESLVDMLAARLPMQEVKLDVIDRLLKKLRI